MPGRGPGRPLRAAGHRAPVTPREKAIAVHVEARKAKKASDRD